MRLIIFILFGFILPNSDTTNPGSITDFFKDLQFENLNINALELLGNNPLQQYAGDMNFLSEEKIDSIKAYSKNYIPTEVSIQDTIIIETTKGLVKLIYFPDIAPEHCYNFKKLANSGFYDMTTFHRIIKNFMIQGGDINSRDSKKKNDGLGSPGWTVDAEFSNLKHTRGVLSMARGNPPNSAGSQFFICHKDAPWLDGSYTIFGKVIENLHVIDLIADTPTEYTVAKLASLDKIPDNENADNWIKLTDPKTKKILYSRIPTDKTKVEHVEWMLSNLRSDYPTAPVIIKKIRVIDGKKDD